MGNGIKNAKQANELQLMWEKEILEDVEIVLENPSHRAFCNEYLKSFSLTQAYIKSHPNNVSSRKTLRESASRYFKRYPVLSQYIYQQLKKSGKNVVMSLSETLTSISDMARNEWDKHLRLAALKEMKDYHLKMSEDKTAPEPIKIVYLAKPEGKIAEIMDKHIETIIK